MSKIGGWGSIFMNFTEFPGILKTCQKSPKLTKNHQNWPLSQKWRISPKSGLASDQKKPRSAHLDRKNAPPFFELFSLWLVGSYIPQNWRFLPFFEFFSNFTYKYCTFPKVAKNHQIWTFRPHFLEFWTLGVDTTRTNYHPTVGGVSFFVL